MEQPDAGCSKKITTLFWSDEISSKDQAIHKISDG